MSLENFVKFCCWSFLSEFRGSLHLHCGEGKWWPIEFILGCVLQLMVGGQQKTKQQVLRHRGYFHFSLVPLYSEPGRRFMGL